MNNQHLNSMKTFNAVLLPNGYFHGGVDTSYFCGRYRGEIMPSRPVEVKLPFPLDSLFVSFRNHALWVNHHPYRYRYSVQSSPILPLHMGCENHRDLGLLEGDTLDYLIVDGGVLKVNGTSLSLRGFPLDQFSLSHAEKSLANMFVSSGFSIVSLVYAVDKPIVFLSLEKDGFTVYLRVRYHSELENVCS